MVAFDRSDGYYIDSSAIDWVRGRLYICLLDMDTFSQIIEVIDINPIPKTLPFKSGIYVTYPSPDTLVPITFMATPSDEKSIIFANENFIQGLSLDKKSTSGGDWRSFTYCQVEQGATITNLVTNAHNDLHIKNNEAYIYFIMENNTVRKIGVCKIDVVHGIGMLDEMKMEEIQHITGYVKPVGLQFEGDTLYWIEDGEEFRNTKKVQLEALNVMNKQANSMKLPYQSGFMPSSDNTQILQELVEIKINKMAFIII